MTISSTHDKLMKGKYKKGKETENIYAGINSQLTCPTPTTSPFPTSRQGNARWDKTLKSISTITPGLDSAILHPPDASQLKKSPQDISSSRVHTQRRRGGAEPAEDDGHYRCPLIRRRRDRFNWCDASYSLDCCCRTRPGRRLGW